MAKLKDVAAKAGVSVATVSYVLNDSGSVSRAVRNKVLAAVRALSYTPNRSAQAMRTGRTKTLGLVLPDLLNPLFPEMAQTIENTARKLGYSTFLVDTKLSVDSERQGIESLLRQGVEGVIWFPQSQQNTAEAASKRVPIVVLDRELPGFDVVRPDHEAGGRLQAEYLLQKGHKRVGLLSGPMSVDNMRLRRDAFYESFTAEGDIIWELENPFSIEISKQNKEQLMRDRPSAVVAGNDIIAVGVIKTLTEAGIAVPGQISVIGFDNISWCEVVTPTLTTIRMRLQEIAADALRLLMQRINSPDEPERKVIIGVELVPRDSVVQV
ncbi:MAG: LacI family DNA-binding transcriptional regulator [Gammaproteobacteria bacterium]|nr:LacI family DNA-binding transcriptional regulator [Gammaproteobacteria bacterium]